jgi:Gram-negative bacterial TonB protein C-terminal
MTFKQLYPTLSLIAFLLMTFSIVAFNKPSFSRPLLFYKHCMNDTVPEKDSSSEGKIYEKVEEEAYFAGGESAWRSYLEQNLNPMVPVDRGAKAGTYTVYIQFIVDIDGKVSAIKPLTQHGFGMEGEVMRILRKSPNWVPAVQAGKKVRAYRKQPVTFQIVEEKKKKRGRG